MDKIPPKPNLKLVKDGKDKEGPSYPSILVEPVVGGFVVTYEDNEIFSRRVFVKKEEAVNYVAVKMGR